jgi:(p)ppGpp synthase/HD superfamily hydrolase
MKIEADLLERAIQLAVKAHAGQKDRYGAPYILHPLRVMQRVNSVPEKIVAVLHDVVEDTSWSLDELAREGFPKKIVTAIDCLTKREGEDYEAFVRRSASNPLARRVKLADLEDNMDLRRMNAVTEKDVPRLAKYLKAWGEISEAITEQSVE